MSSPHIAVVGAGPGGLTLARVLQRRGVAVTVYERDDGPDARDQGGTLDMKVGGGQAALAAAGLLDVFLARCRPEGQDSRLVGKDGTILVDEPAAPDEMFNPEIDRGVLRGLLIDALEPGTIAWGSALDAVVPAGDGRHALHLRDGTTVVSDLVVGADGAWSRIRPLLSAATPQYCGAGFVDMRVSDVDASHPSIAALVGNGGMVAAADGMGLTAQRNGGGVVRVYAGFRDDENWADAAGLDTTGAVFDEPDAVRAVLRRRFAGWGAPLLAMIDECDDTIVDRPLYALPFPHTWAPTAGVTLIGDAAHLMSPFSGVGADTAMLDGAELAQAIVDVPDLTRAVARYEEVMLPRAATHAARAARALESFFSPAGARDTRNRIEAHRAATA